jgi:inorganic pyrophosphatase
MSIPHTLNTEETVKNHVCALIEIPAFSAVKYEVDKVTGHIMVDRFLEVAMSYPCHYGQIPNTLAGDGDELDILVIAPPMPLQSGVYIQCRPIGTLEMLDEKGEDSKIIAVPIQAVTPHYHEIQTVTDIETIHPGLLARLRHFFEHYKDLDAKKWVKLQPGWGSLEAAQQMILKAIRAYQKQA